MAYFQAVMIAAVVGLLAAPATAATALVSNTADAGAGSFRAAVEAANSDPAITSIRFRRDLGTIELQSTVTYTGTQALTIDGRGTEIASAATRRPSICSSRKAAVISRSGVSRSETGTTASW